MTNVHIGQLANEESVGLKSSSLSVPDSLHSRFSVGFFLATVVNVAGVATVCARNLIAICICRLDQRRWKGYLHEGEIV